MCRAEVFVWVSIHVAESESESFSCPRDHRVRFVGRMGLFVLVDAEVVIV